MPCQVSDQGTEGDEEQKKFLNYKYPAMTKTQGNFTLHVRRTRCACRACRAPGCACLHQRDDLGTPAAPCTG
jgi:hypothetical protein